SIAVAEPGWLCAHSLVSVPNPTCSATSYTWTNELAVDLDAMNSITWDAWVRELLNDSVLAFGTGEGGEVTVVVPVDDRGVERPEEGFESIGIGITITRLRNPC